MNRVVIGIITVLVIAGIILLIGRTINSLNLGRGTNVPTSGKLVLPSGNTSGFSSPLITTRTQSPLPSVLASPRPSGFSALVSPKPSATVSATPVQLPATGF